MKKAICLLLSAILTLSISACAAVDPGPAEDPTALNGRIRSQIETALGQSVDFDSENSRYYGTYNDYIVFYKKLSSGGNALSIGGYTFADTEGGCILYAIWEGEYTRLQYIYESGGITDDQLSQIYEIHTGYYEDYDAVCREAATDIPEAPLSYAIEQAIDAAIYAIDGHHLRVIEFPYRFYGQFSGYYILFETTQAHADVPVTVGNYVFHHSHSHVIWVIGETEKLRLPDAYERGWITDANLDAIYTVHCGQLNSWGTLAE